MAKSKKVVAPVVSNEVQEAVATPEVKLAEALVADGLEQNEAQDLIEAAKAVTAQPSLMSQLVQQVVDAKPAKTEEAKTKVKTDKNEGVGQFIRKLISEGLGNKAILEIVHEQYGNKNTTYACVAWYRNKMKKAGQDVKKTNSLEFLTNFAKVNNLSEEAVETLKQEMKVA